MRGLFLSDECPKVTEDCLIYVRDQGQLTRKQTLKSDKSAAKSELKSSLKSPLTLLFEPVVVANTHCIKFDDTGIDVLDPFDIDTSILQADTIGETIFVHLG